MAQLGRVAVTLRNFRVRKRMAVGEGAMPDKSKCGECGTELLSAAAEGLCPRCLIAMGIHLTQTPAMADGTQLEVLTRSPPATAEAKNRYFGDYELLDEIARGGMGVVYRARQVSLNRIVAVKMLLFGEFSSDDFVRRFRIEAEAAARLQHPNIVAIHEIGEHNGQPYYSMDYVDGQNLAELTGGKALPVRVAASYLKTIAAAVQFAHDRGTLHRDLKPSNVIIDIFNQPRLTDFGLAKQLGESRKETATGQVLGSPGYMPPEQAGGRQRIIGTPADVYSMGAILYHLLTGRPPFMAETMVDTLIEVIKSEPVAPRLLNPSVPRDLETICFKCLEKNPVARYATAQELAEDLDLFLRGEPIRARAVSRAEKAWRWCRRQPALAALIVVLIAVAGASTVAAGFFNRLRAEAERHRESARLGRYTASISAAQWDLEHDNAAQAILHLLANKPGPGETDLRGFEWRYLWRQAHPQPFQSLPLRRQVLGEIRLSPDGTVLAAYYWDNTLRLWNLGTAGEILAVTNASSVGGFSKDSRSLLVGCKDRSIRHFDLGTKTWSVPWTNSGELVACADGCNIAVTLEQTGELKVWDVPARQAKFSPATKVDRYLDYGYGRTVAISPDGKVLAVVQLSPSPGSKSRIRLWEVATGRELDSLHETGKIRSFQFSPNGQFLAVGLGNGKIHLWDWASQKFNALDQSDLAIQALAFSAGDQWLAAGDAGGHIRIWSLRTGMAEPEHFPPQNRQVWSLAFSPDGKLLACGGRDSAISIWKTIGEQTPDQANGIRSDQWGNFAFSPDGKSMAAGCKDDHVRVWNVPDFALSADLKGASYAVAFTPDGKSLLAANSEDKPQLWDLKRQTWQPLPHYEGSMANVTAVDISPNCRIAALGLADGSIQVLDIVEGRKIASWKAHDGPVESVFFSPDRRQLLTGGRDRAFSIWDLATQKPLGSSAEHKGAICAVTYSHNGKLIASGCGAGAIKLWRPGHLLSSDASLTYHQDLIRTLAFSMDDRTLASGSEDRTVKLWSIALRQSMLSFQMDSPVRLVIFSCDGNALAVVTDAGTLRVFRAATLAEAEADEARL
jgi:WD40 repeat protein